MTTAIPYINDEPHVGFGMELVYADVLARFARQRGKTTLFSTGTDEHGGKIAEKAAEAKLTPKDYADSISQSFQNLTKLLNISNDRFIRTTDQGHEQRAQIVWKNLAKHIYKGKYEGWYCTGDEAFFTEQIVKANGGVCPNHNRPYEKIEEENYFFRLSAFAPQIKKAIEEGSFRIIPSTRKHEILAIINEGLEDISISRPKDKISWGIPVPGDANQVMYVWFEALMNYITVLGYPEHADFKKFWPADIQVIGKDIIRFHAAIWPGMLLALGLPLPKTLYVHGFINVEGKKMSKSLGNVIHPKDVVDKYGVDTFRYYFLRYIPSYEDGNFMWQKLDEVYNTDLANELGNTVQRTLAMIQSYQNGLIGTLPDVGHDVGQFEEAILDCKFDRALEIIWNRIRGLNQYIEEQKPWEIAKDDTEGHLQEVLSYQVASLLQIAEMLEPFLPETAVRIRHIFEEGVIRAPKTTLFPRTDIDATSTSKPAKT